MTSSLGQIDTTKTSDHYDLDDGDANFPIYVPYVPPAQLKALIKATLSWKRKPFRATANLNPSSITTDASGSSGHSHSHAHSFVLDNNSSGSAVIFGGSPTRIGTGGGGTDSTGIQSNAAGESGHSHSHSHTLTGSSTLVVTEGSTATVTAISFDGIDRTATLGGPWSGDIVELDVSALAGIASGVWHEIALSLSGQGRLVTLLRIYYTT